MLIKNFIACLLFCLTFFSLFSQGTWIKKSDLPAVGRYTSVAFVINGKGYIGTGRSNTGEMNDFWEWDPVLDAWTQKANFGGVPRSFAAGFSIGSKGYIGTGDDGVNGNLFDFWEYDLNTNTWSQKSNCGNKKRAAAFGFSIGNKGYIGTGGDGGITYNDLLEFDPVSNTWTSKANLPGAPRSEVDRAAFVIGNNAYIGNGCDNNALIYFNDFWEYNQTTNAWTQKANSPFSGIGCTGYSICGLGYLGLGANSSITNDTIWTYDPIFNTWSNPILFPGGKRVDQPAFVINNKAYISCGQSDTSMFNDLWEFTPVTPCVEGVNNLDLSSTISIYPNPSNGIINIKSEQKQFLKIINIFNLFGKMISQYHLQNFDQEIDLSNLPNGDYLINIPFEKGNATKKISIRKSYGK